MKWVSAHGRAALLSTLGVNLANMTLGVVTGVATARGLAPEDRGLLLALGLWTAMVSSFSLVGLDDATVLYARGKANMANGLRVAFRRPATRQAVVAVLLAVGINLAVARNGNLALFAAAVFITGIIPMNILISLRMAPLRVSEKFVLWNLLRLVPQTVYASLVVLLSTIDRLSVPRGLAALLVANAVTALLTWAVTREAEEHRPSPTEVEDARAFGRGLFAATIPQFVNQRLDQLLLGLLFAPQLLGVYAVAVSIAGVLQTAGNTLEQVLFPRLVSGSTSRSGLIGVVTLVTVAVSGAAVALALGGRALIELFYGEAYGEAAGPLRLLLIGAIFLVITSGLASEAKAQGRARDLLTAHTVGMTVTFFALPIFASLWGMVGAGAASALSYACTAGVLVARRHKGVIWPRAHEDVVGGRSAGGGFEREAT